METYTTDPAGRAHTALDLTKTTTQISFPDSEIEGERLSFQQRAPVEKQKSGNDPTDYLNKIRRRGPELAKGYGQIVHPLSIQTADGPKPQLHHRLLAFGFRSLHAPVPEKVTSL